MSQAYYGAQDPKTHARSHSHTLSVNSISSIPEPTTPPTVSTAAKSYLWDSHKLSTGVVLPHFSLNEHSRQLPVDAKPHGDLAQALASNSSDRPSKIDKEYLASIAKLPLSQLTLEIPRLAQDQYGCRFLQKRIDQSIVTNVQTRKANFRTIFTEVLGFLYELIVDPFGNYLVQRLIDYCTEDDLDLILESLNDKLFLISINQHGTRALQKVIEKMNNEYQLTFLVKGLTSHIIELIKDLNGNHVIQKILNKYPPEKCQFIYDSIIDNLLVVATHKHGCCVLQKCLNHVNASQLSAFADAILNYNTFVCLVNDQFGNYVLQYLISINSIEVDCKLFQNLAKVGVSDLCNLKFSSNVIEKLMKNCYINEPTLLAFSDLKFTIINLILKTDINKLINDPYGNYVAQTLIDVLINTKVNYYIEEPGKKPELIMSLKAIVGDLEMDGPNFSSLQAQIIRRWFGNCKIVSSFGKRIQLKIATILNGNSKPFVQRRSALLHQMKPLSEMLYQPRYGANKNDVARSNFVQKGGFSLVDGRIPDYPLSEIPNQSNFNYRSHFIHGQPLAVNSMVDQTQLSSSSFANKSGYLNGPLNPQMMNANTYTSELQGMGQVYRNNAQFNGFNQSSSTFGSRELYPAFSDPVSRAPSTIESDNLASSSSMNFTRNAFASSPQVNDGNHRQDIYFGHGRSSSQSAIGFSNPW